MPEPTAAVNAVASDQMTEHTNENVSVEALEQQLADAEELIHEMSQLIDVSRNKQL